MSYLQLDDCFATHPKVIGLSHRAFRLHVSALCYAAQNLTDGLIARTALGVVGAVSGKGKALTDELEQAGVWRQVPDGWELHGYLDWNLSKADVEERKRVARDNANKRWHAKSNADGNADGNAIGIADGSANRNAIFDARPNALPSPVLKEALASPPAFALDVAARAGDGAESQTDRLIRACGGTAEASDKIGRTVLSRRPSFETMARAIDAAGDPSAKDPIAVALNILAPKAAA